MLQTSLVNLLDLVGLASGIASLILFLLVAVGKPFEKQTGLQRTATTALAIALMTASFVLQIRHRQSYNERTPPNTEASIIAVPVPPTVGPPQQSKHAELEPLAVQQAVAELRKQVKEELEIAERKRLVLKADEEEKQRIEAETKAGKDRQEKHVQEEAEAQKQREAEIRARQEQQLREQQYQAQVEETRARALRAQQARLEEARKLEEQERAAKLERDVKAGRKRPDGSWMPGCGEGGCNTTWGKPPQR